MVKATKSIVRLQGTESLYPHRLSNWIYGEECISAENRWLEKLNPATGETLCEIPRSSEVDVNKAVEACKKAREGWSVTPAVKRGLILHEIVVKMIEHKENIARIVAEETGRALSQAYGEVDAAIQCGLFFASEGQRLYGRTSTSGTENKFALTVRQPKGIAGLIIAANTPIANVAWKVFPALVCGNAAVLKAAEDTPATAWYFGKLVSACGLPPGVLNIVQGLGPEAGAALVRNDAVDVVSFTGSTPVGRLVQRVATERMARVSLELGGKNAFVVCDDADLNAAAKWAALSIFSNAGQRCAAASRIIVFQKVYQKFKELLIEIAQKQKVGITDDTDYGAVINEKQLTIMVNAVRVAISGGASLICGGERFSDASRRNGYFMQPTLLEKVKADSMIARTELFGPVGLLFSVEGLEEAIALSNDSPYGLTAAIHTKDLNRAIVYCERVQTGVAVINAGTFGSEAHMPFGGRKLSGNGTREPGTEALDVYSELKDIYVNVNPEIV